MPPTQGDERTSLEAWLAFYRATLMTKCEGLDDEQLSIPAVPPSRLTLLGLVQHMAEVERSWFRRILLCEQIPPIYPESADPAQDEGFGLADSATFANARPTWEREVAHAKVNAAGRGMEETSPFRDGHVTLRWIYNHMIAEYARHVGHADLLRERIDGVTGF